MEAQTKESPRLAAIRSKVENLIEKNTSEVGSGKSLHTIEGEILSSLLAIGRELVEERIAAEEASLEARGYELEGKKNQPTSRSL
jgi:hypothetical protein